MRNYKINYKDPYAQRAYQTAAGGWSGQRSLRADMAPRLGDVYNLNPSDGQMPYLPSQVGMYDQPGFDPNYFEPPSPPRMLGVTDTSWEPGARQTFAPSSSYQGSGPGLTSGMSFGTEVMGATGGGTPSVADSAGSGVVDGGTLGAVNVSGGGAANAGGGAGGGGTLGLGLLGSAGQIAGGIAGIKQGMDMREQGTSQLGAALNDLDRLRKAQPSLGTPTEYYDMVKNAYDQRLMQSRLEDINRGLATTVSAASQYGARGLGATLAAVTQQQRAQQEEVYQQQRLQTSALAQLASARESEIQRREARSTRDIEYAYSEKKAGEARQQYGQQMMTQGMIAAGQGIASAFVPMAAQGAAVKTPGEFSHKKNPIDIVQGGSKIGEMTGGEYIFNPSQADSMRKYAEGGNTPLHKFVRKTLSKFHKNARI